MTEPASHTVTHLLDELSGGDTRAADRLLPVVYNELRSLAKHYLRGERVEHTLQATALVHEAYLGLVDQDTACWEGRAHFFRIAAVAMRRILVDHARAHRAQKRGGSAVRVPFTQALEERIGAESRDVDLVALDEAMKKLKELDPRKSQVVEIRFFAGLTTEETARVMALSPRTVERDWRLARTWLYREVEGKGA